MDKRDRKRLATVFGEATRVERVAGARTAAHLFLGRLLIARGTCLYKTSPWQARYGRNPKAICLHAEVHAIIRGVRAVGLPALLAGKTTLYVARAKRGVLGQWECGLAKPCVGCAKMIREFAITNVYWTDAHNDVA